MKSFATTTLALVGLLLLSFSQNSQAFSLAPQNVRMTQKTSLSMSGEPLQNEQIGVTERLLLERKRIQDEGLVQELGRTIKKDGWDGLRAAIWAVYGASNVVFPVMAVAMFGNICLNLMGYGYYFDDNTHKIVIDSLEHMRQETMYQQELLRISTQSGVMID